MNGLETQENELSLDSSKIEQEALERKIKLGKANDHVLHLIENCKLTGATCLDLSRKSIATIPDELLELTHLESLYLEGNNLKKLPEEFFQKLPCLMWLDIRNNMLASLPSVYIGSHKHLTHLLVQGNHLQSLPLELGQVTTLKGLNIKGNPIKHPPQDILGQGVAAILKYLQTMILSKSNGSFKPGVFAVQDENHEDSEDEPAITRSSKPKVSLHDRPHSGKSDTSELYGTTLALHKQTSYQELRKDKVDKLKKVGAFGKLNRQTSLPPTGKRSMDVNVYPEPPPSDIIDRKVKERQTQAIIREKNEKIDAILQRRKDEEKLKRFRDDAKTLQRQKDYEKYMNGGKLDYAEPGKQAPFDIADEDMKMMSNQERIKKGIKEQHERIRKVLSPQALKLMELEKQAKEKELKDKIKEHTESMKSRRKKPKGNPQEEMDAALKELEIAKRLQTELDRRRRNLDYRFKAYNPPG
ncbi:leucine-rich repeat-containing protein 27-like isoform X2 [Watersipora subatra]|uniref:leucine-rich repeat-containing protein 27-like isoform X2 n=1 Tax=Watersipora subatra TaxID=2589382 RepID=UPI00355B093D